MLLPERQNLDVAARPVDDHGLPGLDEFWLRIGG